MHSLAALKVGCPVGALLQSFRMDKNCELPGHMRYKYVCVWPYGSQPAPRFEVNNQLAPPPKRQLYHTVCATTIGRWADSLEWHRVACASAHACGSCGQARYTKEMKSYKK